MGFQRTTKQCWISYKICEDVNIPMKRIFYTYNFVKLHEKINDRKNGDSSEWYGLNVNNQNIITQVISGKFDLQYC